MKILKFYSDTCPPCKLLTEQLLKRDTKHLNIIQVNVKIDTELKTKYGVRKVPTIIQVSDDGEELKRFGGIEFIKFLDENPPFPIIEEPIEKMKEPKDFYKPTIIALELLLLNITSNRLNGKSSEEYIKECKDKMKSFIDSY